jgi:hypothetical protein
MTPHTPGKWVVAVHPQGLVKVECGTRVICDGFAGEEANARLIAAAPELLAACREALALLENPDADGFEADRVEKMLRDALRICVAH